jgi:pSer/pThr/pTyr-binding forkhead associated (FHA) protein
MTDEVRLTLVPSADEEVQQFTFAESITCTVGRADDCTIVVPPSVLNGDVSRHHCQVQVGLNPTRALVRDLESLNGTYVNGVKIGQRFMAPNAPEARQGQLVLLKDGDELRLGKTTTFRVEIREHAEALAGAESPAAPSGFAETITSLVRGWWRTSEA